MRSLKNTLSNMRLNTNSGTPLFTRRNNQEAMQYALDTAQKLLDGDKNRLQYTPAAILG